MVERKVIQSGAKWEDIVGYSRVVRVGQHVYVAGTTATSSTGDLIGGDSVYEQARFIFSKIEASLQEAGAEMRHVVRTRLFVTDATQWEAVGRAHSEAFDHVRPVATLVEVSALIGEAYLIEIEVDAYIHDES